MRARNIKINIFLNEEEKQMLIDKSNKDHLSQFDFFRLLIKDYTYDSKPKIDIDTINTIINSSLTEINNYMHRLRYEKITVVLNKVINKLNKIINNKSNAN